MQIKEIHGKSYAIISEHQLGVCDGVATITNCIPVKFISEIVKKAQTVEDLPVYMVSFISFKPSQENLT